MKKVMALALLFGAVVSLAALSHIRATAAVSNASSDNQTIANVLEAIKNSDLNTLASLPAEPFTLPKAGVDVMRVRMEETYTIDGVGTDTVELRGWIAARHDNPRPVPGQTKVSWETGVVDTDFVGLELRGESKIFGPVLVHLTQGAPSFGQVGAIDVPELRTKMAAAYKANIAAGQPKPDAACLANIHVNVEMPQLDLHMKTQQAVRMYSVVETIPPVGNTASVSLAPTSLISADRNVGTLQHAEVKFREIVMRSALNGSAVASR
jgi:hypothetical protein